MHAACGHALGPVRDGGDHPVDREEGQSGGVDGVEERLLVLLEIAVVGERESLQDGQQRDQVADRAAALAAHQLGHVGFFFWGIRLEPVE